MQNVIDQVSFTIKPEITQHPGAKTVDFKVKVQGDAWVRISDKTYFKVSEAEVTYRNVTINTAQTEMCPSGSIEFTSCSHIKVKCESQRFRTIQAECDAPLIVD